MFNFSEQKSPTESESGYTRTEGFSRTASTAEYDYADSVVLNKLFRLQRSQSERTTLEISIGDLNETTQNQQQEQQQGDYECIDFSTNKSLTDGGYENIENYDIDNKSSGATRKQRQLEADEASSRATRNDSQVFLTGEYVYPEEYMEMGKRRTLVMMDNQIQSELSPCQSFDKIDEEEPEYYVLECAETDGGEFQLLVIPNQLIQFTTKTSDLCFNALTLLTRLVVRFSLDSTVY